MRFETAPGRQGQVDFAHFRLPWGKRYALIVVLGYSRLLWVQFYTRQTMKALMHGLESSFSYFGGVPRELLFDQMKAVVIEDGRYDDGALVENPEFMRYAYHWNFRIRACRPYRAQTKGKVERPIRYLRESFFYGRTFTSDDDLNAQALHWLETEANVRSHATLKERPLDRFECERLLLEPLATRPYHPLVLPPDRSSPGTSVSTASNRSPPSTSCRSSNRSDTTPLGSGGDCADSSGSPAHPTTVSPTRPTPITCAICPLLHLVISSIPPHSAVPPWDVVEPSLLQDPPHPRLSDCRAGLPRNTLNKSVPGTLDLRGGSSRAERDDRGGGRWSR